MANRFYWISELPKKRSGMINHICRFKILMVYLFLGQKIKIESKFLFRLLAEGCPEKRRVILDYAN